MTGCGGSGGTATVPAPALPDVGATSSRMSADDVAQVPSDPLDLLPEDAVVAVAMSGGVDSAVAAARCVARGLATIGITLAMWPRGREVVRDRGCCGVDAVSDARRVAAALGIRHYVWDLEDAFRERVIAREEEERLAGRTPNPCIVCNDEIKLGALLRRASALGATHLATGHYARVGRRRGRATLHRALDRGKDQAYVLYRIDQERLAQVVFPLGGLTSKAETRAEAARLGLPVAGKPDSVGLCFVDGPIEADLRRRLGDRLRPGPIVDEEGRVLGSHAGVALYTVGQRAGLGLRPRRPDQPPLYVVRIDAPAATVVVGPRERLLRDGLRAVDCRWLGGGPPAVGHRVAVQLRAHGPEHPATVVSASPDEVQLRFDPPAGPVVPGQAAVLAVGDEILGGGVIADGPSPAPAPGWGAA